MQNNIEAYIKSLKVKDSTGYELAARECKGYFDERGIEYPTPEDWKQFEADYPAVYKSKRGKEISEFTLKQNYVARGKAFYRWCMEQAGMPEGTPSLFSDMEHALHEQAEQATPPAEGVKTVTREEAQPVMAERNTDSVRQSEPSKGEATKPTTRISFLLDTEIYRVLSVLSALKDKTMTEILTAGAGLYIKEHPHEAEIARRAIEQVHSQ